MVAIEDSIIDLCTQQEKLRKTLHDKRAAQLDMFAEESHETLSLSKVDFAVFLDQSKGVGEEQLNAMQNIYARSQTQLDEMMSSISSIQEAVDALPTQQSREREEVQKEEQLLTDRQLEHQQLIASLNARVQKAHTANANQKQQLEAMIDQQMQTNLRVKQTSSL